MENIHMALMTLKPEKQSSGNKKNKLLTSNFRRLYQATMDSAIKKQKETENKKRYRLSMIIQKLLAGIILTSDEVQFLKENAPAYYNQAMRQQMNYRAKNAGQHKIGKIEPISFE